MVESFLFMKENGIGLSFCWHLIPQCSLLDNNLIDCLRFVKNYHSVSSVGIVSRIFIQPAAGREHCHTRILTRIFIQSQPAAGREHDHTKIVTRILYSQLQGH